VLSGRDARHAAESARDVVVERVAVEYAVPSA
jgi:hypothetical protein